MVSRKTRVFSSASGFLGDLGNRQPVLTESVDEVLCSGLRETPGSYPAVAVPSPEPALHLGLGRAGAGVKLVLKGLGQEKWGKAAWLLGPLGTGWLAGRAAEFKAGRRLWALTGVRNSFGGKASSEAKGPLSSVIPAAGIRWWFQAAAVSASHPGSIYSAPAT